ncbi:S-adenosylmethionine decarboxylase [Gigaspora margarita]|uniref:S-adenosylmethionine decarboxylase proenzyme n=2 Tax=Gigaspora margarita TaxID=4874 RepID=A0A8H4ABX7_GIGMA|nr:S-adenosylmethionine decarboxylase [Gigaspora margarita]
MDTLICKDNLPSSSTSTTTTSDRTLDSSNGSSESFEGPEKLLEIWFEPSPNYIIKDNSSTNIGLRSIERGIWDDMLNIVKCKIINMIENDHVDAYLLSESSMFVYQHKIILKTCGTTTLLAAIPRLLKIASEHCQFHKVWRAFYSRKSFMFPERQSHPHNNWKDEVAYLEQLFDNGSAYTVGRINGDHWFLYLTSPPNDITSEDDSSQLRHRAASSSTDVNMENQCDLDDQTVEVLMTELNPKMMKKFYCENMDNDSGTEGGARVDRETGLKNLYPSAKLDSFLFKPCGYSANGLLEDSYFTIHVTPELSCSYASFETNIPLAHGTISEIIHQLIAIFEPGKFIVTVFKTQGCNVDKKHLVNSLSNVTGYVRKDRILYDFDGYDLVFGNFEKRNK